MGTLPLWDHTDPLLRHVAELINSIDRAVPPPIYDPAIVLDTSPSRLYVDKTARIDSFVKIEVGMATVVCRLVHVASFVHLGIGGGVLILEEGASCASGVRLVTGSNVAGEGHGCSAISPTSIFKKSFVHLKPNATCFVNSAVMPGVTIGEEAVLLPGGIATCDIPDGETWGGVPARKIKGRKALIPVGEVRLYNRFDIPYEPTLVKDFCCTEEGCGKPAVEPVDFASAYLDFQDGA